MIALQSQGNLSDQPRVRSQLKTQTNSSGRNRAPQVFRGTLFKLALLPLAMLISQLVMPQVSHGQTMINTSTPFNTVSDSFYERMGVDFGFSLPGGQGPGSRIVGALPGGITTPNLNFSQNGLGSAVPPFGNFDPNSTGKFGFSYLGGNGGGFSLGLDFGQGSTRTHTNVTPSVTTFNGASGSVFSGAVVPFVTGFTPIVGQGQQNFQMPRQPAFPSYIDLSKHSLEGYSDYELNGPRTTVTPRQESSATVGSQSVSAIKRQREQNLAAANTALLTEINQMIAKADASKSAGKDVLARLYYRKAIQKMRGQDKFDDLLRATVAKFEEVSATKKD